MNVETYLHDIVKHQHPEKHDAFLLLYNTIENHIPKGFAPCIAYNMIGFVVPHSIYPKGYHCDSKQALPFLSIAAQKNFIALYHMGIYADNSLLQWFTNEFPKHSNRKLDMGKSCIRFKKPDEIPMQLIAELVKKMTVQQWIDLYERSFVSSLALFFCLIYL